MCNGSDLPLLDTDDHRGMGRKLLGKMMATSHGRLTPEPTIPPEPAVPPRLPSSLRFYRALYLPKNGELHRLMLTDGGNTEELTRALDQHQDTRILIIAGTQDDLGLCLKGWDVLKLNRWNRKWRPVSQEDMEKLGIVFDLPAEPVPAESGVSPEDFLADVRL